MEVEQETPFNHENNLEHERYSDEELELDQIKRKKLYPQCIIDSEPNSEDENNDVNKQEPQTVDLTETADNKMNSPEDCPDMGSDMSDMIQNLMQSRPIEDSGTSTLQCSECGLECPSLQAFEFHTKLHVMEKIVQSSYKYPGIGLKKSSEKVKNVKAKSLKNGNAKRKSSNQRNKLRVKKKTNTDEARDIETIMESLVSQGDDSGYTGDKPHKCTECGFRFKSPTDLKRHMQTHTGDKPYGCTECDYRCARKGTLKIHMRKHNPEHKTKFKNSVKKVRKSKKPSEKKIKKKHAMKYKGFICPECDHKCTSTSLLRMHMVEHSDQRPFKCGVCDDRFNAKISWKEHLQSHFGRKFFSCTYCEFTCSIKAQLTRHMLTHTGTKPHECPQCDYRCNEKGNLAKHMVTHGDEKPFSCPEEGCNYTCKFKVNLKPHMLKHSGQKPYECHLCDYSAYQKGTLNTHMINKHTGEKPFPCYVCGYRAAVKGDLNTHMRIHTNNRKFKCPLCDYRGYTKQKVNQHMNRHTGEKPHECGVCGSRFSSTSSLKKHGRTHTGEKLYKHNKHNKKHKIHMQAYMTGPNPHHSDISNDSSQAHQFLPPGNTQPQHNQHLLGANSIMGRSSQETTYPDVNYKMFSNNMDYNSLSKRYDNFPTPAKPLWHQGSSSLSAVNTDGYNCQALSDMLQYTRKVNTQSGENLAHIAQSNSHNPLSQYPRPMVIDTSELAHFNSKFPITTPVPPNMSEIIRHANDMYNIQ